MGAITVRIAAILCLVPVVLFINGCVNQPAVPQDRFYRLPKVQPGAPLENKLINGTVSVDQLDAEGIYRERPLLYVDAQRPLEVLQYHYRHWIKIPPQLIQDSLVDYLREANLADSVERYARGRRPALLITGRLQKFERLVQTSGAVAVVEIEIEIRKQTRQGTVKITKTYKSQKPAQGPSIHDSVAAFGQVLQQIYDDVLGDLKDMEE